jgi:Ca2+/H+ antiporter
MLENTLNINLLILCTGISYILYRICLILNTKNHELIIDQESDNNETESDNNETESDNNETESDNNETDYDITEEYLIDENTKKRKRKLV